MKTYRVTYRYLASGMEGKADIEDLGVVEAANAKEAKVIAAFRKHPDNEELEMWARFFSSAEEIQTATE